MTSNTNHFPRVISPSGTAFVFTGLFSWHTVWKTDKLWQCYTQSLILMFPQSASPLQLHCVFMLFQHFAIYRRHHIQVNGEKGGCSPIYTGFKWKYGVGGVELGGIQQERVITHTQASALE